MAMAVCGAGSYVSSLQCVQSSSICSTTGRSDPSLTVRASKLGSSARCVLLGKPMVAVMKRRDLAVRATIAAEEAPVKSDFSKLKADLLAAVAGLDRGLVAEEADELAANAAALKLEAAADPPKLPGDLDKLQGRWRLIFSSGFKSGSYGGQRPGPNIARSPFNLGSVFQRIDTVSMELDNIVDLLIPVPWPLPPLTLTATLAHSFQLAGGSKIKIIFEKTILQGTGFSQLPAFELPKLPEFIRPRTDANGTGSGEFETTYLDDDFRISRGDRGELRIFVKA